MWSNSTEGLEAVIPFTAATLEILRPYKVDQRPGNDPEESLNASGQTPALCAGPRIPVSITLRDYQQEAIRNWFKNNGRGTFRFATGDREDHHRSCHKCTPLQG